MVFIMVFNLVISKHLPLMRLKAYKKKFRFKFQVKRIPYTRITFYYWSSNLATYNRQSIQIRTHLFAVLQWSVNYLLKTCYNELKCLLKILSFKSLKNSIDYIGNSWNCNVNDIIMDTNNFNKHCSFNHFNKNLKKILIS